jgi:DNA (cytosine-5)-methyltransferase 1
MRYVSLFSGIEAASVAWKPLGWEPVAFSEIAPFPSAVLAHHYPDVPNLGDMTQVDWSTYRDRADLVCGGSPCQSFSVAGLRKGMDDPRGNLALEYLRAVDAIRPRWVVWENVPGVLSSGGGRDFGTFLGSLAQLGYGWAYRVMDAQYVRVESHPRAVPQRRRRVWVVGCLGDWRGAAAVLLERESMCGHPAPRRESGQAAPTLPSRDSGGGFGGGDFAYDGGLIPEVSNALCANDYKGSKADKGLGQPLIPEVARTLTHRYDSSPCADRGMDVIAFNFQNAGNEGYAFTENGTGPLDCSQQKAIAIQDVRGFDKAQNGIGINGDDCAYTIDTLATQGVAARHAVRRLTPLECERLQGFPDDYTRIPVRTLASEPRSKHYERYPDMYGRNADGTWTRYAADGPRYKALGNSWAVNVASWGGQRIQAVETAMEGEQ